MTAVGAYIPIPIGPVPIVLQNLFVLLAGLLLGGRWGFTSIGIYLLVGAVGMPVFTGGKGGVAHFIGPTGGYLIGFALCAFVTGWISEKASGRTSYDILAVITGSLLVYACGVPWLKAVTAMSWNKALVAGMLPFLMGDALKAALAVILARAIRPVLHRQLEAVSA
ncbi:MAG: biotin transporter BioY [Deltaproteobacteria bacterium]|nr:biotin transporter BioY [Deltaproteobacteria bacterium]